MFTYKQGAILNIKRLGNILSPTEDNSCTPDIRCEFQRTELDLNYNIWSSKNQPSTDISFVVGPDHSPSRPLSIMRLLITHFKVDTSLSLGPENSTSFGFFVTASSQLVLILNGFLQVWRLPSEAGEEYELIHVEAFVAVSKAHANDICQTKVSSVQSCIHGRKFNIEIEPIQWLPDPKKQDIEDGPEQQEYKEGDYDDDEEEEYPDSDWPQTLTFPRTARDTFTATEKYRYEKGIVSLIDAYADSELGIKDAIIRFLVDRIRPTLRWESSLVILCRSWIHGNRAIFEELIAKLLPDDDIITWTPDINATKNEDPLSILVRISKNAPSGLGACKIILKYCVNHAIRHKHLGFLTPFLRNIRRIMNIFPDEGRVYLRKIAYIPVSDRWREHIVQYSTVARSPWQSVLFRRTPLRLDRLRKPILHLPRMQERPCSMLHVMPKRPRNKADTFNQPIYAAAFDVLWYYKASQESVTSQRATQDVTISICLDGPMNQGGAIPQETTWRKTLYRMLRFKCNLPVGQTQEITVATSPHSLLHQGTAIPQDTTWWKTFYHIFRLKCRLNTHTYVTCYAFSLEFLDNPAIAALLEYKWITIGYTYWAIRFFFQSIFCVLVLVAALLQVYHDNVGRAQLGAVFVSIILVGAVFLWLEFWQAFKDFSRYRRNPYNLLDIIAYSLPMVASGVMLKILCNHDAMANTRILSYSVLAVFLHMLFELRIYKSVGRYVGIIRWSISKTRVFLFIFAGGLVAFTISTLHLLRACPLPGLCEDPKTDFSKHFLGALSTTYFFVGGRFEPVAKELDSDDWAFHLMMVIFFFFTVIVMLNVLIALINEGFTNGDDDSRFDCIEARLRCIELAENLSYHIPGFRQTHDWFPQEIYFFATAHEVEEYEKALRESEGENKESLENDPAIKELKAQVQKLEHQLTSQQEREERRFQELKDLLLGRAEHSKTEAERDQ